MWLKQLIFKICFFFFMLSVFALPVQAEEKQLTIFFDKDSICCIMNADTLVSELENINGIRVARYDEDLREILVYFNSLKINIQTIVDEVSKITEVEKRFILTRFTG